MCVKQVVRMTPPAKHERQETNIRPRWALFRRRFAAATAPPPPPPPASCTADAAAMHLKAMVGSMPAMNEMAPRSTIATTFVVVTSMLLSGSVVGGECVNVDGQRRKYSLSFGREGGLKTASVFV